jgi:hypothetical protein
MVFIDTDNKIKKTQTPAFDDMFKNPELWKGKKKKGRPKKVQPIIFDTPSNKPKQYTIINATGHDICIMNRKTIKPDMFIRLAETTDIEEEINGIPVFNPHYSCENMPPQKDGVIYVVSSKIAGAFPYRNDLYIPYAFNGVSKTCR